MKEKIFGYSVRNRSGELAVGVVTAKDINEAKKIIQDSFCIKINYDEIKEIDFDSDGVCELYYGS